MAVSSRRDEVLEDILVALMPEEALKRLLELREAKDELGALKEEWEQLKFETETKLDALRTLEPEIGAKLADADDLLAAAHLCDTEAKKLMKDADERIKRAKRDEARATAQLDAAKAKTAALAKNILADWE